MSSRSTKSVLALSAVIVAGASFAAVTDSRAQATTDTCLTAPKGLTPAGGHWRYRIDRTTKRQCWYLREESDESEQAQPQKSAPAPSAAASDSAPSQPGAINRKSIADARAEWLSQQPRSQSNFPANAEPRTTGTVTAQGSPDNKRAIGAANVLAPTPLAATRWPDSSGVSPSSNPADLRTAASDPPADPPQQAPEVQQQAAVPVAAAPTEAAMPKPTASLQMLLVVMAGALAIAGIIVSLVVRIGRVRARRAMRRKRRAMWDSVRTNAARTRRRSPAPTLPDEEAPLRHAKAVHNTRVPQERPQTRVPRERPRVPQDRERQVKEMLSRLARSSQS
jgi:hypothetical protein